MLVVLDTTVLIDALRGRPVGRRVLALRESEDSPATSALSVEEVIRGMRPSERRAVDTLVAGLDVLSADEEIARLSGAWRSEYAARGVRLHQADCLIAATAAVHGARLCTGNPKDYPMLEVDHWPVGE